MNFREAVAGGGAGAGVMVTFRGGELLDQLRITLQWSALNCAHDRDVRCQTCSSSLRLPGRRQQFGRRVRTARVRLLNGAADLLRRNNANIGLHAQIFQSNCRPFRPFSGRAFPLDPPVPFSVPCPFQGAPSNAARRIRGFVSS